MSIIGRLLLLGKEKRAAGYRLHGKRTLLYLFWELYHG